MLTPTNTLSPAIERIPLKSANGLVVTSSIVLAALLIGTVGAAHPMLLIAGAIGLACACGAVFLLTHPQRGLSCSFLLVMIAGTKFRARDPNALLQGDIDNQIFFELAAYGLVFLITLASLRGIPRPRHRLNFPEAVILGYVALAFLSFAWSADFRITLVRGAQLFVLCALCLAAVRVLGPERLLRAISVSAIFYVLLFSLIAFLFPWANRSYLTYTGYSRFSWFAVHPIVAATYTGSALLFLIAEGLFAPGSWRRKLAGLPIWLYAIPLLLIFMQIHSRGPLFAFIVAILGLGIKRYLDPWLAGIGAYALLVILVIPLGSGFSFSSSIEGFLGKQSFFTDYLLRGQAADQFMHVSGRLALWDAVYDLVSSKPVLGYGYAASRKVILQMIPWAGHAHNALMESLLNLGVVGGLLLWIPLIKAALSSMARSPANIAAAWQGAAVFGILLFLIFVSFSDATFAGPPGFAALLFFAALFSQDRLRTMRAAAASPTVRRPMIS